MKKLLAVAIHIHLRQIGLHLLLEYFATAQQTEGAYSKLYKEAISLTCFLNRF
jgi:hypothetical protein